MPAAVGPLLKAVTCLREEESALLRPSKAPTNVIVERYMIRKTEIGQSARECWWMRESGRLGFAVLISSTCRSCGFVPLLMYR